MLRMKIYVIALQNVYTPRNTLNQTEEIPLHILMNAQLIGHPDAKMRRNRLGELLQIGYTNGKQLQKRLSMFQIES